MPAKLPERIVCLTEETTETLYLLGEERRIVGISGYTVRPPRARREKPRVSAFLSAKNDAILALKPDLVLGFSDLQADIARDLAKAGGLLRGMGRADDQRHPLGERAGRDRGRRGRVREPLALAGRERTHRQLRRGGGKAARRDDRLLVRQEVQAGAGQGARRLGRGAGGARRRAARDQVGRDPAARPGGAHRRRAAPAGDHFGMGGEVTCTVSCGKGISMPRSSNASFRRFRYSRLTFCCSTAGTTLSWPRSTTAEF